MGSIVTSSNHLLSITKTDISKKCYEINSKIYFIILGLVKRADSALPDVLLRDFYLFALKIFRPRDVLPPQRLGRVQPARLLQSGTLAMKIICCETFILMMGNTFLNCVKIDSFCFFKSMSLS